MKMDKLQILRAAALVLVFSAANIYAAQSPSLTAQGDFGIDRSLKALAAKAGENWREVAEQNRTIGLERLSGEALKRELMAMIRKYADPKTGDVGGEPVEEIGEIAEAACRAPYGNGYCWALWRNFFSKKDVKIDNPVTAAKLLAGFERSVAGVRPLDAGGTRVDFAPQWQIAPFNNGTYRTPLPGGGCFESSWSNSFMTLTYRFKTSAREVVCGIQPKANGFYSLKVDGRKTAFARTERGCTFTVTPNADGVVEIELRNSISWGDGKGEEPPKKPNPPKRESLSISFDGDDPVALRCSNVTTVRGVSGNAAHLGKDSYLEYSAEEPGFMTPESGTLTMWFKHDKTFPSGAWFRDRDRDEDFKLPWIPGAGWYLRTLFESGLGARFLGGVGLYGTMGPALVEIDWNRRMLGGEWHFLAFSYDAKVGKAVWYVDGTVAWECDFKSRINFAKTFTLGSGGGRPGLEGAIDEVRFYPRALGLDELGEAFHKVQPILYELNDWSVVEGETKKFRFRARNASAAKVEKKAKFSNGAVVSLSLAPNELKEFTVKVKGGKPGLFKLFLNEGEPDARQFECICLAKEKVAMPTGKKTLVGEYDCTKEYPIDRVALCLSSVVTNGSLAYLESATPHTTAPLAAYRFDIRNQGRPHIVEMDYPDDKARSFLFGVYPEKWGRIYAVSADCAGVMTGIDYPLSGKMHTKQLVFWPDSERVTIVVQNFVGLGGVGDVEAPAACAAVRLYEMDGLPPGPVQGMAKDRRSVAEWDEDPNIDAALTFSSAWSWPNVDLEFWRVKWQRILDYMRWNSQDSWVIKVAAYHGDSTGMDATIPEAAYSLGTKVCGNGRCRGWAELGADMLSRAGMGFWVRINHRDTEWTGNKGWFHRLGGGKDGENFSFGRRNGSFDRDRPNFLNPVVRKAYLRLVAAYRDKFSAYPGFRGLTMNEALPAHFGGIDFGYDDTTIGCFERDTGIKVPARDMNERHAWLTGDKARLEKWLKWRCGATAKFAAELAATMREKGGNAEIQIWVSYRDFLDRGTSKWLGWNAEDAFRGAGIDAALLAKIPGVRLVPCVAPDRARHDNKNKLTDLEYFQDAPSWVKLMRESGTDVINVFRHSIFEIWPRLGAMGSAAKAWKTPLWLPAWSNLAFDEVFQCYATPHAPPPYTLDSVASLVADADVQDFLTGFWGIMESGEHDEWCRFYGQFRQIPRGRYALAKGSDDPVAVRSGAKGHYLVNREPYPVKVEYIVDGKAETLILRQHEIRFVEGRGANGRVEVKSFKIPTKEKAEHLANLEKLEAGAKAAPKDATLARAAKEAREAFESGRFRQFRALFHLGAVRKLMHPELYGAK